MDYYEELVEVAAEREEEDECEEVIAGHRRLYTVRTRQDPLQFYSEVEFKERFRLSKQTVIYVVGLIENEIRPDTEKNHALSPELQVLIALRFLATGTFHRVMGDLVGIERTTAGKKIRKVIHALAGLRERFVKLPVTRRDVEATKRDFHRLAGFPEVLGAIDCTHVRIICPALPDNERYRNRKGYMSINVQAVCNANYKITNVVARWPGSTHDSRIWENSRVAAMMEAGEIDGIFVGDGGYRCTEYMMTPLRTPATPGERRYNKAQARTRNPIERTFGMLKTKFPCLALGMRTNPARCGNAIIAAVVLYNIAISAGELEPDEENPQEDELEPEMEPEAQDSDQERGQLGNLARAQLIQRHFE